MVCLGEADLVAGPRLTLVCYWWYSVVLLGMMVV